MKQQIAVYIYCRIVKIPVLTNIAIFTYRVVYVTYNIDIMNLHEICKKMVYISYGMSIFEKLINTSIFSFTCKFAISGGFDIWF